ncbi:MAG: LemA family protein [Thermoplasmatota archaeon]
MGVLALVVQLVVAALILAAGVTAGVEYSSLATGQDRLNAEANAVVAAMQRRFDLVPTLGVLAENLSDADRANFANASAWRASFVGGETLAERDDASVGIARLFVDFERVVHARYGAVARSDEFAAFVNGVNASRAAVVAAKTMYDSDAAGWNAALVRPPASLIAATSGFAPRPLVAVEPREVE